MGLSGTISGEYRKQMSQIRTLAIVTGIEKGGMYRCRLEDNPTEEVLAHLCGKMRIGRIVLCVGDTVTLELSPYDLHRGRVVWRET